MINKIIATNNNVNPYYIVSPSYNEKSAGLVVLHRLCHHLNLKGFPAYLIGMGIDNRHHYHNPNLITSFLTDGTAEIHRKHNKTPIVVYPDIIIGNPLNSKCVVRYLLNYPGLLGGDKNFPESDLVFSYTRKIADRANASLDDVLFMPISDSTIFYPPENKNSKRSGSCFYASKYRDSFEGELFDVTNNSIEITCNKEDSQTKQEIAELLRKSEFFYSYEDTSLISEAILCGCPAILIKNKHFKDDPLATYELGRYGMANYDNKEEIERAKDTVEKAQETYFKAVDNFFVQLDKFIDKTQSKSMS
ncbi:MAG: hypothetical protein KGQ36_01265 [Rickettsiales bacterium]|nr:hypothetical protein [Rickettsiales bacterium]